MAQPDDGLYSATRARRPYWVGVLVAADQLINALLAGHADETLSSRAWRSRHKRRWRVAERVINTLFFADRRVIAGRVVRHCELSYLAELHREHLPKALRSL